MTPTPRITFAVLTYNQSAFIEASVRSALSQTITEPIEILLSDDASTDDTFAKMQRLAAEYRGPHQIVLRRNERNLGIGKHCIEVYRAVRGQLIVLMAGDDISTPDRAEITAQVWDASGQTLDLIACNLRDMTRDGQLLDVISVDDLSKWASLEDWMRQPPHIIGAGHACTRRLLERFGPFTPDLIYEDQVNILRAILSGGACTIAKSLVHYRRGGISSRANELSGPDFIQWRRTLNARHMTMHEQWLRDARTAGRWAEVNQALHRLFAHEYFWQSVLATNSWPERIRAGLSHQELPLLWRLRKVAQLSFPRIIGNIRYWLFKRKQLRRNRAI